MKPSGCLPTNAAWKNNLAAAEFTSPPSNTKPPDSELWFTNEVRNGSLSASVTQIHGEWEPEHCGGYEFSECVFIFRRTQEGYYAAGIGGFGNRYFIARVAQEWKSLNLGGRVQELERGQTHNLRVEFFKDHIKLFENDVLLLSARDGSYSSGICGIRTNRTEARFEKVDIAEPPKCFVVMPFKQELDNVYRAIQETVEEQEIECLRADELKVATPIFKDIQKLIKDAKVVIVDFTGGNRNVYFEAGLATAWEKPLIFLTQSKKDLAFNVEHIRTITYSYAFGTEKKLKADLKLALKETLSKPGP
jgi:hypothetical protein